MEGAFVIWCSFVTLL